MVICGIDEAGRGPLAGPVVAAAVVLPEDFPGGILADSKALSPRKRAEAEKLIRQKAITFHIAEVHPGRIDEINILQATLAAMKEALEGIALAVDEVLIDGNKCPSGCAAACRAVIKGDTFVPQIMAASILAKTHRDRIMEIYALQYPGYGFERHKGYPTKAHWEAILKLGPCPIHRRSFRLYRDADN
ncbi:MAG: ribonuclease HII [Spirochaetales bacterium]|jgi:ribonuclease HII|nr:ribonuclease HII [Spirochaetales bacterium]